MADIKLFNIKGEVKAYKSGNITLEKELQTIIENNMETFFGIKFLISEYRTTDGGRIDSIGIDENYCPVIFEYKRSTNENVMNQGLFYLNWLLDHKDSFKILVIEKLDIKTAEKIDWSMPRVVCIAGDFTRYDESAIKQMDRNISLIRYKKFGEDLLMFEQINENIVKAIKNEIDKSVATPNMKTFRKQYETAKENIRLLYDDLENYILSLGDDINENELKLYKAFKKIKNFITAEIYNNKILVHLHLDTDTVDYEEGLIRNMSSTGHWGTGDVEIILHNKEDLEKIKPLLDRAYNEN